MTRNAGTVTGVAGESTIIGGRGGVKDDDDAHTETI